jgi:hypothetical protein
MATIPWGDSATLTRRAAAGGSEAPAILFEGTLRAIVQKVALMTSSQRKGLRVALPDRHVRPYSFDGVSLAALVEMERSQPPGEQRS